MHQTFATELRKSALKVRIDAIEGVLPPAFALGIDRGRGRGDRDRGRAGGRIASDAQPTTDLTVAQIASELREIFACTLEEIESFQGRDALLALLHSKRRRSNANVRVPISNVQSVVNSANAIAGGNDDDDGGGDA